MPRKASLDATEASGKDKRLTEIGARIRTKREELGMFRKDLGEHVGVTVEAIKNWEMGANAPSVQNLPSLAAALGVSEGWIWEGEVKLDPDRLARLLEELVRLNRDMLDQLTLLRVHFRDGTQAGNVPY